jgi:hypothetical protein
MSNGLNQHWNLVATHLREARAILDTCDGSLELVEDFRFKEYVGQNELELALDELEGMSDSFELPREFWKNILKAANAMGLHEHSKRYQKFLSHYG